MQRLTSSPCTAFCVCQGGKLIAVDELLSVAIHGASNVHPIPEFNEWYDGAQLRAYITKKTLVKEYDDGHSATSEHGTKRLKVIKHETHTKNIKSKEEEAASSSTK